MKAAIGIPLLFLFHMSLLAYGTLLLERKNAFKDKEAMEANRGQHNMVLEKSIWKRYFDEYEDLEERFQQLYNTLIQKQILFKEMTEPFKTEKQNARRALDKQAIYTNRDDDEYVIGNDGKLLKRSNAIDFRSLKGRLQKLYEDMMKKKIQFKEGMEPFKTDKETAGRS